MAVNRRQFALTAGGAFATVLFNACTVETDSSPVSDGRLTARPKANAVTAPRSDRVLGLDRSRDAILQLPAKAPSEALPLFVMLHGAGGSGEGVLRRVATAADEAGIAVLAPDSRDSTWDAIRDGFGPDVAFIDRALARVFDTVSVDPARIAVGGFSDGASYALSLGLVNGDLFRRVVAFSPGFIVAGPPQGKPQCFISHGSADQILPIDRCSRVIVPQLQRRGYDVTFKEFDGGHQVPPDIARDAMRWVAG
jgi:phospholipase/carboxylesterase